MALVGINTDLGSTTSSEEGVSTAAVSGSGSSGTPARGEEVTSGNTRGGQGADVSMKRPSKADRLWLRCLPMLVPEQYHVTVHERTQQQARQLSRRSAVAGQSPPDSGTEAGSESSAGEGAEAEVEEQQEQKESDGEREEKQEPGESDEEQARGTKRKRTEGRKENSEGGGSKE